MLAEPARCEPMNKRPEPAAPLWTLHGRGLLFEPGTAPFQACHASTITEVAPGDYCAAWFGGTREGAADTAIWLTRRLDGTWGTPECVACVRDEAHWNPVLFHDDASGQTQLYFKVGMEIPTWETWVMRSTDGGRTWSEPAELVPGDRGGRGPCKNKPIRLSNGDLLAPASLEGHAWQAFVDRSSNNGRSWAAEDTVPLVKRELQAACRGKTADGGPGESGVIQPTLWESAPGCVHMLLRSTFGRICRSDSDDDGHTWCRIYPTDLPNNNSGIDLVRLQDDRLVLVCNPVAENWGERSPLTVLASDDNGATWTTLTDLEDEPPPAGQKRKPEFSYPGIIRTTSGLALVYTWKRRSIAFVEGDLS
jgi:predicted neuraminidase